jgi:predicted SnoaL-like aldol condensation-catalyzing enzyme
LNRSVLAGRALTAIATLAACGPRPEDPHSPKAVVNAFDKMGFIDHKPVEAVLTYFAPDVIEHDPTTPGSRDAIIAYMKRRNWSSSQMQDKVYRVIAEGDLVVVHHQVLPGPGGPGLAAVDIFRVKNGKVVEHWDVLQPTPATSANNNGMF